MIKRVFGLFIISVGILLFLSNVNVVDFDQAMSSLFSLFVLAIGVVGMYERKRLDIFYLIVTLLGISLLLSNFGILEEDMLGLLFVPAVIIVIGIKIIDNNILNKKISNSKSYTSIFGGLDEKNTDKEFTGCEITSIFGGGTVDFRGMKIKGDKAYINVTSIFGGNELIFSKEYKITINGTPIFGGMDNKLLENNEDSKKEIIINYLVIFGGLDIRN